MMTDFDPTMNENKLQISLFDEQREKSDKNLDFVKQKLSQAKVVMEERKSMLENLEKEKKVAEEYLKTKEEECILKEVEADFSTEDEFIPEALEFCRKLYETPTLRAYNGIKKMLDKIADYMSNSEITEGRDGNGAFILRAAKDFDSIRQSFKSTLKDLEEEQSSVRGNKNIGYDQG